MYTAPMHQLIRKLTTTISLVIPLALASALLACGGATDTGKEETSSQESSSGSGTSGGSSSETLDSGLNDKKAFNQLIQPELELVCELIEEFGEALSPNPEDTCHSAALSSVSLQASTLSETELQELCTETRAACLKDPEAYEAFNPVSSPDDYYGYDSNTASCNTDSIAQCGATVGEFEDCLNSTLRWLKDLRGLAPSCENLSEGSLRTYFDEALEKLDSENPELASCRTIETECP